MGLEALARFEGMHWLDFNDSMENFAEAAGLGVFFPYADVLFGRRKTLMFAGGSRSGKTYLANIMSGDVDSFNLYQDCPTLYLREGVLYALDIPDERGFRCRVNELILPENPPIRRIDDAVLLLKKGQPSFPDAEKAIISQMLFGGIGIEPDPERAGFAGGMLSSVGLHQSVYCPTFQERYDSIRRELGL